MSDVRRPAATLRRRLTLGPVTIDSVTKRDALQIVEKLVAGGDGGAVFTPNVDHIMIAHENERMRVAYSQADLSLADGVPVLWAARILGKPLPAKISGSDLVLPLMERAEREGWRVYILGGAPGVGALAAKRLVERFPRIVIAGTGAPLIDMEGPPESRVEVLEGIRAAKAHLVLVALGAPKQELWMTEAAGELRPAVLLGVGAAVDFIAGTARRAPHWMSASGLEWLFRLAQEPRRMWKRYLLRDPEFFVIVLRDLRRARSKRGT